MTTNDSFAALPKYLQRRIDKAFDASGTANDANPADSGGGFIAGGGGFLVEDSPTQIPLSAIPGALQRLDLPPDDEQVLLVFKNAASGWQSTTNRPEEIGVGEGALYVSKEDWRSVCTVLLEHRAEEYEDSDGTGSGEGAVDSDGADEDEYQEQDEPDADSDSDSDEYMEEGPSTSRRRTRSNMKTRRSRSSSASSASSASTPKKLTARQKKTCLDTYALFFPKVSEEELTTKRIGIKDIQRLTKLIGDKLKGDEIIEMLGEFSTSPDKNTAPCEITGVGPEESCVKFYTTNDEGRHSLTVHPHPAALPLQCYLPCLVSSIIIILSTCPPQPAILAFPAPATYDGTNSRTLLARARSPLSTVSASFVPLLYAPVESYT
ncbi:hypothetical protein MVEN_01661200 [Mycena venus]|uniref:Uncharacterized protein n=1 Tax=Mycena venus TaxID=2733690 RepID=A0A8H6XQN5_9AGAR|nr:hypothetical protein MVEN_01661200 [Mycena venus]